MGQRDDFVAACLDRAGFVGGDMAGLSGDHALVGAQDGSDHGCIGLSAADKEIDVGLRRVTGFSDQRAGVFRELICAVAGAVEHICLHKTLHDRGVGAFHVIGGKKEFAVCILAHLY